MKTLTKIELKKILKDPYYSAYYKSLLCNKIESGKIRIKGTK